MLLFQIERFILALLDIYIYVIIINAVLSWLIAFGVINTYNRLVSTLVNASYRLTEPALRPIRHVLPDLGGLDISPIILLLFLEYIVRGVIVAIFAAL